VALDILSLPRCKGESGENLDAVAVVLDRHSGWIEAWPVEKKGLTSRKLGRMFVERWLEVFGTPSEVHTDNDHLFTSGWWKTMCAMRGVAQSTAIAYRPQSNGGAERAVRAVIEQLRKLQMENKGSWIENLLLALRLLRTTPVIRGVSPYMIVFGRDWLADGMQLPNAHVCEDAAQLHARVTEADIALREAILRDREAEASRQAPSPLWRPTVGERVWLKRQKVGTGTGVDKLDTYWAGPFPIIERRSDRSFLLDLGHRQRLVSLNQIKPFLEVGVGIDPWPLHFVPTSHMDPEEEDEFIVENIQRHAVDTRTGVLKWLVKWRGYSPEESTWESAESFLPGYNVIWRDYCRKHKLSVDILQHVGVSSSGGRS
jgi:hypothetical protein